MRARLVSFAVGSLTSSLALASVAMADDEVVVRLNADTGVYSYAEYTPPGYDDEPDDAFHPLVVFLHGAGEQAPVDAPAERILNRASVHGPFKMLAAGSRTFADEGAIVVAPVAHAWWNDGLLRAFLSHVVARYRVDWRRVYVTGISMGGGGTFVVGNRHGARVAAYAPICPAGSATGSAYVGSAVWGFHSRGDGTVTVDNTWAMLDRVGDARAGMDIPAPRASYPSGSAIHTALYDPARSFSWVEGRVATGDAPLRGTIYPDSSHDSWTRTYADPAVWRWMFDQRRPTPEGLPEGAVIVDALHPGVTLSGAWTRRDDAPGYFFWDFAVAEASSGAVARFPLRAAEPGVYEVYLGHVRVAGVGVVDVEVEHAGGTASMRMDLASEAAGFVSLGRFAFEGEGLLTLSGDSGSIVADAVALVYREPLEEPDGGVSADGGVSTDGSVWGDAGVSRDSGVSGGSRDASLSTDAGAFTGDAATWADGGTTGEPGGCACRASARRSSSGGWLALLALGALVHRRTARRRSAR